MVDLLYERRDNGSTLHLWASLGDDGELRIEGQDFGPVTASVSDDGEYEYGYTIGAADVPAMVTALGGTPEDDVLVFLKRDWADERSYGLGQAIRESEVPFGFWCYS